MFIEIKYIILALILVIGALILVRAQNIKKARKDQTILLRTHAAQILNSSHWVGEHDKRGWASKDAYEVLQYVGKSLASGYFADGEKVRGIIQTIRRKHEPE